MKFGTHSWGICLIVSLLSEGMWSQTYTGEFFWARSQYLHVLCTMHQSAVNQPDSQSSFRWSVNHLQSVCQSINQPTNNKPICQLLNSCVAIASSQSIGWTVNQSVNTVEQSVKQSLSLNTFQISVCVSKSMSPPACSQSVNELVTYSIGKSAKTSPNISLF